jgi:alkylhydroperoxidase/carboxymuconolactone decarboxylase family protein YurZ
MKEKNFEQVSKSIATTIDDYCDFRTYTDTELQKASPVYAQLVLLNNQALKAHSGRKDGMSQKSKVLTLVSIHSMSGARQSIEFAVSAAIQVGASESEILDAIDLALLTGGGHAIAGAQFAVGVLRVQSRSGGGKKDRFQFINEVERGA